MDESAAKSRNGKHGFKLSEENVAPLRTATVTVTLASTAVGAVGFSRLALPESGGSPPSPLRAPASPSLPSPLHGLQQEEKTEQHNGVAQSKPPKEVSQEIEIVISSDDEPCALPKRRRTVHDYVDGIGHQQDNATASSTCSLRCPLVADDIVPMAITGDTVPMRITRPHFSQDHESGDPFVGGGYAGNGPRQSVEGRIELQDNNCWPECSG